jgi:hypothetical protein
MFWDLDVQDSRRIESRWAFSDGWTSQNGMREDCRGSCQLCMPGRAFSKIWITKHNHRGEPTETRAQLTWDLNVITIAGSFDSLAVKGTRGWVEW